MTRYQRAKRLHTLISCLAGVSLYGLLIVALGIADWIEQGL